MLGLRPRAADQAGGGSVIQAIDRAARILAALQGSRHLGISELGAVLDRIAGEKAQ